VIIPIRKIQGIRREIRFGYASVTVHDKFASGTGRLFEPRVRRWSGRAEVRDARGTDRAAQLTNLKKGENAVPSAADVRGGIEDDRAGRHTFCFAHGQTTERTITAAERLGRALGVTVRVLPYLGRAHCRARRRARLTNRSRQAARRRHGQGTPFTTVIDQICHGKLSTEAAQSALESAGRLPPASTPRFTCSQPLARLSLGVIFGTLDARSLLLIAGSAAIGALVRRGCPLQQ